MYQLTLLLISDFLWPFPKCPFNFQQLESDHCLLRWKKFIFQSIIICSLFVFELMNIKGPTRFPNTVQESVISINSKTQQKSVTVLFTGTNSLIMINCLYCQNPQELFPYPHNTDWKWSMPANSNKFSEIVDQSEMSCQKLLFSLRKVLMVLFLFWGCDMELQSGKVINKKNIKWNKISCGNFHF